MTISDALMLRVGLEGVSDVVRGLGSIESAISSAAGRASLLRGVGAGLAASGVALALTGDRAFESFEKMRRSFVALRGEAQGNSFAKWLDDYSVTANATTESLQEAASRWLRAGGDIARGQRLVTGAEKLFGIGTSAENIAGLGKALGDIRNAGKFAGQERIQLINSGIDLDRVAKNLGVRNIRQAEGMNGDKVIDAILKAINDLPRNVPLGSQARQNALESFQRALRPTGALLQRAETPLANLASGAGNAFFQLNETTKGAAGLAVVIGLVVGGGYLLWRNFRSASSPINRLRGNSAMAANSINSMALAADRATAALNRLANCRCPGGGGLPGVAPTGPTPIAPMPYQPALPGGGVGLQPALPGPTGVAGGAAALGFVGVARAATIGVAKWLLPFTGVLGAGLLASEGVGRLFGYKPSKSLVQTGQEAAQRVFAGDPYWYQAEGDARRVARDRARMVKAASQPAATRPQRRHSAEQIMSANLIAGMGG